MRSVPATHSPCAAVQHVAVIVHGGTKQRLDKTQTKFNCCFDRWLSKNDDCGSTMVEGRTTTGFVRAGWSERTPKRIIGLQCERTNFGTSHEEPAKQPFVDTSQHQRPKSTNERLNEVDVRSQRTKLINQVNERFQRTKSTNGFNERSQRTKSTNEVNERSQRMKLTNEVDERSQRTK